jgi:hypothetical protein
LRAGGVGVAKGGRGRRRFVKGAEAVKTGTLVP